MHYLSELIIGAKENRVCGQNPQVVHMLYEKEWKSPHPKNTHLSFMFKEFQRVNIIQLNSVN